MSKALERCTFVLIFACFAIVQGCTKPSYAPNKAVARQEQAAKNSAKIGRSYEQHGVMSSEDYLRWEQVGDKVGLKRRIDDDDLSWATSMMQKSSTQPAEVHIDVMSLFLTARTFTPIQKQKIRAAVTPSLLSSDRDEPKWARAVIKRLDSL